MLKSMDVSKMCLLETGKWALYLDDHLKYHRQYLTCAVENKPKKQPLSGATIYPSVPCGWNRFKFPNHINNKGNNGKDAR